MEKPKKFIPDLPRAAWTRIARRTALINVLILIVSVISTIVARNLDGRAPTSTELSFAVGISLLMAVPVVGAFLAKVEEVQQAYAELDRFAQRDSLTDLLNRGAMLTQVEASVRAQAAEGGHHTGCLLVLDVDQFKRVNDTFGHDSGDDALQSIAAVIRANIRNQDLAGRMGGEEFAIFAPGVSVRVAHEIAEKIRQDVENIDFRPIGEPYRLSVSAGLCSWPSGAAFKDVYRQTDVLLYRAKRDGRNRVVEGKVRAA